MFFFECDIILKKQYKTYVVRIMSQASPKCYYSDCRNVGMTTTQCVECDKHFCDEHMKAHHWLKLRL